MAIKCINPFGEKKKKKPIKILQVLDLCNDNNFDSDMFASIYPNYLEHCKSIELLVPSTNTEYDVMRIYFELDGKNIYIIALGYWNDGFLESL